MQFDGADHGGSQARQTGRCLAILIPTYRRPKQLGRALSSIFDSHSEVDLSRIQVIVGEDGSGSPWDDEYNALWRQFGSRCTVFRNEYNLGMAENLLSLAHHAVSPYSMVLTDDDTLIPGMLPDVLALVERAGALGAGLIALPRLHVGEDGVKRGRSATVFHSGRVRPSGTNALRLTPRAHILTGLVLRTDKIVNPCWSWAINNAYFPMAIQYYAVRDSGAIFSSRRVVNHTIDNETHWHRWGSNRDEQSRRLYCDKSNMLESLTRETLQWAESRREKIQVQWIRKALHIYYISAVHLNNSSFDYQTYRASESKCGGSGRPISRAMFTVATCASRMLQRLAPLARKLVL